MPYFLFFLAIFLTFPALAQASNGSQNCLNLCPKADSPQRQVIHRPIYSLSYNAATKFAHWVAYRVTANTIGRGGKRNWRTDPDLAPGTALTPADFKHAHRHIGTDRGHLVPLASFTSTPYWQMTNYLSNVTPQKSALNQGPWARLERAVRQLAKSPEIAAVWVATGPLFERPMPALPSSQKNHQTPSGFWKVIATNSAGQLRQSAFIFDQDTGRREDHCGQQFRVSLAEIERRSSIRLYGGASLQAKPLDVPTKPLDVPAKPLDAALGCATSSGQ